MVFCGNCGKEVKDPVKFCPHCGTPMTNSETTTTPPEVPTQATTTPPALKGKSHLFSTPAGSEGGLFAPHRTGYIVHENSWDWGSGDIYDENGRRIGRMDRKFLSLRAEINLTEPDGTVAAKIHKKLVTVKPIYEIKDASDNLVGKIEKALISLRPKLAVTDDTGNKLLEIKGNFRGWDFRITDVQTGNAVGTVKKLDRWKDVLFKSTFDRSDKYALKIQGDIDRQLVVGAVIAIDNMFHDE